MTGKLLFNKYRVSVWASDKVLEIDSCDDYTPLCIHLMPPNCPPKNGQNGNIHKIKTYVKIKTCTEKRREQLKELVILWCLF